MANSTVRNINININGKEVVNSFAGISKAMRETNRDIANLNANDADYQEQLKKHKQTLALLRDEYQRTREEIGRVPAQINKVKTEIADLGVGMLKAFSVGAVVGKAMQEFELARQVTIKFDQAQADLAGVMETNKKGVSGLTEDAKKYGASTSFSATQVSELQLELAKLGKTELEIKGMTKGVLDAAVALDAELGPAAELVGGQLNSFGEDASQAQRYADVLANSANISAASFESQATALPKVSAVAAQMNMTFERTNAILGVLADQNVAAETSGTGLRNILLTAAKEGRDYEDMLRDIANSTDSTKLATEMFGKENATVAVILANSFDKVEDATKRLENSVGSAAALAETKLDSVTGAQTLFNSAWEGMILSFDDGNGIISESTKGLYNLGTELIGLIAPSNQLSDAIFKEQVELNALVGQITSTNIANDERERLISELKATYPEFIGMIDSEKLSNDDLKSALYQVNEQYRERILLQTQVEKLQGLEKAKTSGSKSVGAIEIELAKELNRIISERGYRMTVDYSNVEKSARELQKLMKADGARTGLFSDYRMITGQLNAMQMVETAVKNINTEIDKESKTLDKIKKDTGLITEEEKERAELAKKAAADKEAAAKRLAELEGTKPTGSSGEKSKEQLRAEKKAAEAFKKGEEEIDKILQESKDRREAINLQGIEKEKQQIEAKYAVLFEKYKNHTDRLDELKAARDAEIAEAEKKGNAEIDAIIKASQEQIELNKLKGFAREEQQITNKYAKEIEKYKGHTERIKELEAARDAEIEEARRVRTEQYKKEQNAIDQENELVKKANKFDKQAEEARSAEERALILLEKTREIALLELSIEQEKELAKVEAVEGAEELKAAIREKYALQSARINDEFTVAEKKLKSQQVDWTKLTEEEKLNATRSALTGAAEAFNEGSGAWKAAKIGETTIATYQSATNAYNALAGILGVGPALGAAAAALAVASGLKNVQRISQTPLQKMPTYYYGGFTGNGNGNFGGDQYGKFTGMTHADEWVSPAVMTQSPRYAPIINWLDNERQMLLNGGGNSNSNPFMDPAVLIALAGAVNNLNDVLSNGIEAKTLFGYEEIEKMQHLQSELNQTKQNAIISHGN